MIRKQIKSNIRAMTNFLRNSQGLAAVEFAIVLPFMLVLFFGAIETTNLLTAERRTEAVAATLAALVARTDAISNAEMDDIFSASTAVMADFPAPSLQMVVTSIVESGGTGKVAWSRAKNATADSTGGTVSDLPNGLLLTGGSVIRVKVILPYTLATLSTGNYKQVGNGKTIMNYNSGASHTIQKTFYLRPRLVQQIPAPS